MCQLETYLSRLTGKRWATSMNTTHPGALRHGRARGIRMKPRKQQFGKTPSQNTIILKNLCKKKTPISQWRKSRSYHRTFSFMPQIIFSFSLMWSGDSMKWSFLQNNRNFKPGCTAEQRNMCPGTALPAVYWQQAAGLGINQINRGWRKNILPSPRARPKGFGAKRMSTASSC